MPPKDELVKKVKPVKVRSTRYPQFAFFDKDDIMVDGSPENSYVEGYLSLGGDDLPCDGKVVAIYEFVGLRKVRPNTGVTIED